MAPAFSFAGLGLLAIGRPQAHPPSRAVTGGDFTNGALPRAEHRGDDDASQILACCNCCGFTGCGRVGADLRLRLGRLAWWLAWRRLAPRLGWPALRRRPRLLRRRL